MGTLLLGGVEMQRNMDLIRLILFQAEANEHGFVDQPQIEGWSPEEIGYHVYLIGQAGLVEVHNVGQFGDGSPSAILRNLTWRGHDFVDLARNDTIWNKAKEKLEKVTSGVSIQVWILVLTELVKNQLGL